jgi:hypothetical protein
MSACGAPDPSETFVRSTGEEPKSTDNNRYHHKKTTIVIITRRQQSSLSQDSCAITSCATAEIMRGPNEAPSESSARERASTACMRQGARQRTVRSASEAV